jgi:hypothetical protein
MNPLRNDDGQLAIQEILHLFRNLKVHYFAPESTPLAAILSET